MGSCERGELEDIVSGGIFSSLINKQGRYFFPVEKQDMIQSLLNVAFSIINNYVACPLTLKLCLTDNL